MIAKEFGSVNQEKGAFWENKNQSTVTIRNSKNKQPYSVKNKNTGQFEKEVTIRPEGFYRTYGAVSCNDPVINQ